MTLSEVAAVGKASILIPSPNVTNDQQTKNAKVLSDKGAAVLLRESELSEGKLTNAVKELMENDAARLDMAKKAQTFAVRDAEERIFKKLQSIVKEYQK